MFGQLLCCGGTRQPVGKPVRWVVFGFLPRVFKTNESKVAAAGALLVWAKKRVKSGAPYEPAEQKCQSGIEIQPVNPRDWSSH